jgi:hypothetical protein
VLAVYVTEPNPKAPLDALVVGERPDPEVPPDHVRVTLRAATLNMHDVWTLRGVGIKAEQSPMILGCDGAGVLDDGSAVVLHSMIASPGWIGDENLDPRRTLLTEGNQAPSPIRWWCRAATFFPSPTRCPSARLPVWASPG